MKIIPKRVTKAINAALDQAFRNMPSAAVDRAHLFNQLLDHYDQHGTIPAFTIEKTTPATESKP